LLGQNHEVYCIDNFTTGRLENITLFLENPQFHLIEHDIRFPLHWNESKKIDQIYNLACPASPLHYQKDPLYTLDTCYLGMKNMLELAKKYDATILQASTSEVYGDPHIHPQVESYRGNVNPIGIRSCYDEGKRVAETLCVDYHRKYNTNIKIIRIFNTYGPHMDPKDGRVVSNFIMQALRNEDITIYGDGNQTRSFQYIDDLLAGMVALMNSQKELI
jgi:UDP-glucuronate decarboxylase